jgi:release factor glutamine methyltransferase
MPDQDAWTIGRLLQWTADYLKRHDADSPRLDAEVLLAEVLHCQRIELYTRYDELPDEPTRTSFRQLVRRRAEGTPVAYLVGRREFYSLSFRVTPDVLIPRPETEFLVIGLLDLARKLPAEGELAICDVGTGSGIVAVCAAKQLPRSRVTAIDISPQAIAVARSNAEAHGVAERIEFVQSDLFAAVDAGRRFDFVASNPPYVTEAELAGLMPEVRNHEPRTALAAGPQGTAVIEPLIAQAAARLKPGGHLLIEISPTIHAAVCRLIEAHACYELGPTIKDLARLPRVVQAKRR